MSSCPACSLKEALHASQRQRLRGPPLHSLFISPFLHAAAGMQHKPAAVMHSLEAVLHAGGMQDTAGTCTELRALHGSPKVRRLHGKIPNGPSIPVVLWHRDLTADLLRSTGFQDPILVRPCESIAATHEVCSPLLQHPAAFDFQHCWMHQFYHVLPAPQVHARHLHLPAGSAYPHAQNNRCCICMRHGHQTPSGNSQSHTSTCRSSACAHRPAWMQQ